MAFFNRETGELCFQDGLKLSAGLPVGEAAELLGDAVDGLVRLPSHAVSGGRLIPILTVDHGTVQSIALCISSIASNAPGSTAKQRAFLFSRLGLRDPAQTPFETVTVRCPFGELSISADLHTGRAEARIIYAIR